MMVMLSAKVMVTTRHRVLLSLSLCAATASTAATALYRQELTNVGDAQYTGDLSIGGQNVRGIFDTGSFEVITMSTLCDRCKDHKDHPSFDHKKSGHYTKGTLLVEHVFGSGPVLTQQGYDDIAVGPMKTRNQTIWEITDHKMDVLDDAAFEAIIGIGPGPKETSNADAERTDRGLQGIKEAVAAGVLPREIGEAVVRKAQKPFGSISDKSLLDAFNITRFSVCLQAGENEPGWLIWSDEDPRKHQGFMEVPVIGRVHWGVELRDVALHGVSFKVTKRSQYASLMQKSAVAVAGGQKKKTQAHGHGRRGTTAFACKDRPCAAVIDSGTSLIVAPSAALELVETLVQDLDPNCNDFDKLPNLVFMLGGQKFELPPDAYIGKFVGVIPPSIWDILFFKPPTFQVVSACVPLFMRMDKMTEFGDMWILGMPFFRHYYTTFETQPNRTLHMAKANEDCTTPDTALITPDTPPTSAVLAQQGKNIGLRRAASKQQGRILAEGTRRSGRSVAHVDASKIRLPTWAMGKQKYVSF